MKTEYKIDQILTFVSLASELNASRFNYVVKQLNEIKELMVAKKKKGKKVKK